MWVPFVPRMMEIFVIFGILYFLSVEGLHGFSTRSSVFRAHFIHKNRVHAQIQQEQPIFTGDRSDPNWWLLFDGDQKKEIANVVDVNNNSTDTTIVPEDWKPNIGAWRTALQPAASVADTSATPPSTEPPIARVELLNDELPPTLYEYMNDLKPLGEKHENNVKELWVAMSRNIRRLTKEDLVKVEEAFRIAYIALWGQQTIRSLEISIQRARGIAAVLGQLRADVTMILAGILSDVLVNLNSHPFADSMFEHLESRFGKEVIDLCTKYNRLPVFMSKKTDYTPIQSENQLQMLVAVAEDYRVLDIRLADRLHTMRILKTLSLKELEQKKLAQEALYVYAPLAHRMGVMKVKGELEDLAFKTLNPEGFKDAKYAQVAAYKNYYDLCAAMEKITREDNPYLKAQGARCKVIKRVKDKYQLALKMQRKNLTSSSQVRDALGIRIIVDHVWRINKGQGNTRESEAEYASRGRDICYHIIEELRKLPGWTPAQFKDYIEHPKGNGYQSLHQYIRNVAVNEYVEIQVRTRAMHIQAELGEPAHWYYKDQIYRPLIAETKIYRQAWRSPAQLLAKSAVELLTLARQQLLANRVYVFLDDCSTVLNLQKGATALDAAFALHSDVGLTLVNVRAGDKAVGLSRVLQNKLVVSFECSSDKTATVKPAWLDIVKTNLGEKTIRKYFREHQRGMLVCLGCVQLLMCMTLSSDAINRRYPKKLPDAAKLSYWATKRSQCDISEVLEQLGISSKTKAMQHIGGLLDIPAKSLTVSSISLGLIWARMQGKNGWEDKTMQRTILISLMTQILPTLMNNNISHSINATAGVNIQQMWIELVGERSLIEEDEPDALKSLEKLSLPFVAASPERSGQELDYSIPYVIRPPPSSITTTSFTTTTSQSTSSSSTSSTQDQKLAADRLPSSVFDPDLFGIIHLSDPNGSSARKQIHHPKISYTSTYSSSCIDSGYLNIDSGYRVSKSPISLLRQPYALEAPSLSMPLLKMAKKSYCVRELSRELCQGQRSFV